MSKLLEKIKKNSTIKDAAILSQSRFFKDVEFVPTPIPAINIALSGQMDGGVSSGITMFCGKSKSFKSFFSLVCVSSYMKQYPESVCIFYDSEFGSPLSYFESLKIDMDRVQHVPLKDIEEFKFDIMKQLDNIERGDELIIFVDSIGNLASKKEIEDTLNEKTTADMTRAKQLKSVFRMITPHLNLKDIPLIAVNHSYQSLELYSKDIVSGGTGSIYNSNSIFMIGKQQEKDDKELLGYNFIINVEKSRFVKEGSKIPITVKFEGGINKWSGLLDMALESGHVVKPKNGWYARVLNGIQEEKSWREKQTNSKEFWADILQDETFHEFISNRYKIANASLISDDVKQELETDTEEE